MLFVIIARRREVEEEPSARAHLLFPLTLDRDTKSADSKRRKKERDDIRSLALSLSRNDDFAKKEIFFGGRFKIPFPLFARTHHTTLSSFEPRRCVFPRERERVKRERKQNVFFSRVFFSSQSVPKRPNKTQKRLLLRVSKFRVSKGKFWECVAPKKPFFSSLSST